MEPAAKIILETRTPLSTGKYPVKIRIRFKQIVNGKTKLSYDYTSANDAMFEDEFEKLQTSNALKFRWKKIKKLLKKAEHILEIKPFISKERFFFKFKSKGNFDSFQGLMNILKDEADINNQIKTRNLFGTVINSITEFTNQKSKKVTSIETPIIAVDEPFLNRYEEWLLEKEISYSSVATYMRYIRETWNFAIDERLISEKLYPFGRRKYVIPATDSRKIALSEDQLTKLLNYSSTDKWVQRAVDFWKLSFYCFGINFKDIVLLKWSNFETIFDVKVIRIFRAKTFGGKRRKRAMKKMEIPVTDNISGIINKYGQFSLDPNAYVFSVLEPGLTEAQIQDRKDKLIGRVNERLKEVSRDLNLPKITTYTARHTVAYLMKKKGFSLDKRQEVLDHADQKTTQGYGGGSGFDIEDKVNTSKRLYS